MCLWVGSMHGYAVCRQGCVWYVVHVLVLCMVYLCMSGVVDVEHGEFVLCMHAFVV